ncbi:MAG: hypothetical protein E7005_05755 [Alphaproteobacteria bacterium]|nr:hypothetical protein [Alphaproteobacteria bacterium]
MRKIASYIMIIMMLTFVGTKPADALILDPMSLSAKISDWMGKVTDAVTKITQQISQIKQTATQGFSKLDVFKKGKEYLKKYKGKILSKSDKAIVEDTKSKEKGQLEDDKQQYQKTSQMYYETKQNVLKDNKTELETDLKKTKTEIKIAEQNLKIQKTQYETIKANSDDVEEISKARDKYDEAQSKLDELVLRQKELEANITELEKSSELLDKEASIIGTSADPEYKAYEDRIKALDASKDEEVNIGAGDVNDLNWDDENLIENFTIKEDEYKKFIKKYFYSEFNITGDVDKLAYQTEMDKVTRNRKHLVVNSAIHLLQVTATIRRELPERTNLIKEMYDGVRSTDSEFQAIGYYSGTKVENMRALLLYAKLQSAKLQYIAAKDLLTVEPRRRGNVDEEEYEGFDLGKYKLTDSYVKAIEDEGNIGIDAFKESK